MKGSERIKESEGLRGASRHPHPASKRNQSWLLVGKRPHCFVALTPCFFLLPAAIFVFIFIFTSHSFLTSARFPICFTFIQLIFCFPEQVFSSAFITFSIVSILYLIFLHHFLFSKYLRPLFLYYTVQFCPKVRFHVHSTSCLCLFFFLSYSLSPLWSCSLHPHTRLYQFLLLWFPLPSLFTYSPVIVLISSAPPFLSVTILNFCLLFHL